MSDLVKEVHKDNPPIDYDFFLMRTWASDLRRPWDTYVKDKQFSYFWDTRVPEPRSR